MKKTIRLNENDLNRLVKKVIFEHTNYNSLLKEFCLDLERSVYESTVSMSPRLRLLLKKAQPTVFEPFGIDPSEKKYFIAGSARLYLYPGLVKLMNLKPIGDLDIIIPNNKYWEDLEDYVKKYPNDNVSPEEIEMRRYTPTEDSDIEVFDKWLPKFDEEASGDFEVRDTLTILKNSKNIEGYYFMSFYDVLNYKMTLKREKELPIINLLMKYKEGTSHEKHNIKRKIMSLLGNNSDDTNDFLSLSLL